jgi:hypothetical protein
MRTLVFYRTLKSIRKDERFEAILSSFPGAKPVMNRQVHTCDIAVIQGWKNPSMDKDHVAFRREIIENQFLRNRFVLTVDGNIFNYMSKNKFFRYSINGVFANTGYYFDAKIDPMRWEHIKRETGCSLKPWRKNGEHILILAQKDSGWTMPGISNVNWIRDTVRNIRLHSDRPIRLRIHPTDVKFMSKYEAALMDLNIDISSTPHIAKDLENAWCSISHNSSPGAVSVIEGVPVFITDSNWKRSPAHRVGNNDLKYIEDPHMPDREEWIQRISMSHYTVEDIKQGHLWKRVSEYLERKQ